MEAKFLLAYSLINLNQNEQAIQLFEEIIRYNSTYRKDVYLYLGVANKNIKKLDRAKLWVILF